MFPLVADAGGMVTPDELLAGLRDILRDRCGITSFLAASEPPVLNVVHAGHSLRVQVGSAAAGRESFIWKDELDAFHRESPAGTLAWFRWWAAETGAGPELLPPRDDGAHGV